MLLIGSIPALSLTDSFRAFWGKYIFRILLRLLCRKVSRICSSPFVIFHVSLPLNSNEITFELNSLILVFLPIFSTPHTLQYIRSDYMNINWVLRFYLSSNTTLFGSSRNFIWISYRSINLNFTCIRVSSNAKYNVFKILLENILS